MKSLLSFGSMKLDERQRNSERNESLNAFHKYLNAFYYHRLEIYKFYGLSIPDEQNPTIDHFYEPEGKGYFYELLNLIHTAGKDGDADFANVRLAQWQMNNGLSFNGEPRFVAIGYEIVVGFNGNLPYVMFVLLIENTVTTLLNNIVVTMMELTMSMMIFSIGLFETVMKDYGLALQVRVNLIKNPHIIITGSTGSGKTYASQQILANMILSNNETKLYLCDYKGDNDFDFLIGVTRFYRYQDCYNGILDCFNEFVNRQKGLSDRTPIVLFFDEYSAFINILDKSEADDIQKMMTQLLSMGRSFNIFIIMGLQRPDAKYFNGNRGNFSIKIGLGNMSKESANMLFPNEEIKPKSQGFGYVYIDGIGLIDLLIPTIGSFEGMKRILLHGVSHDGDPSP